MALRADPPHVVRPLVAGGLQLPVVGGALGLALAVAATRLPGGLPFEIDALDPLTFLGVPPGLAAAALPATYLPAHRGRLGSIPSLCSGPTECGRPERHGPRLQATQHVTLPRPKADPRIGADRASGNSDSLSLHHGSAIRPTIGKIHTAVPQLVPPFHPPFRTRFRGTSGAFRGRGKSRPDPNRRPGWPPTPSASSLPLTSAPRGCGRSPREPGR